MNGDPIEATFKLDGATVWVVGVGYAGQVKVRYHLDGSGWLWAPAHLLDDTARDQIAHRIANGRLQGRLTDDEFTVLDNLVDDRRQILCGRQGLRDSEHPSLPEHRAEVARLRLARHGMVAHAPTERGLPRADRKTVWTVTKAGRAEWRWARDLERLSFEADLARAGPS